MKITLRKFWLQVHLYLGLTAGLIFALLGLTGSVLVFERALDEQLHPDLMLTQNPGTRRPLNEIIAAARAAYPELPSPDRVGAPRVANGVFEVRFNTSHGQSKPEVVEVYVDPSTSKVLGRRVRGSGIIATIYRLHATLLAGHTGETIVGTVALLVLISIATGIYLWWPLWMSGWRAAWSIRPQKLSFDLHKVGGAAFTPILALIAFTGVYLVFPAMIKPLVTLVSTETRQPQKVKSKVPPQSAAPLGPDQAVAMAIQELPGSRLISLELPQAADGVYRAYLRQDGEVGQLRGAGRVWIDQYSGKVLASRDWNKFTFADTFFRIQLALHNGDAFGIIGRWLFVLTGLIPITLYVTGLTLWWRKRQSRRRQQHNLQARQAQPTPLVRTTASVLN